MTTVYDSYSYYIYIGDFITSLKLYNNNNINYLPKYTTIHVLLCRTYLVHPYIVVLYGCFYAYCIIPNLPKLQNLSYFRSSDPASPRKSTSFIIDRLQGCSELPDLVRYRDYYRLSPQLIASIRPISKRALISILRARVFCSSSRISLFPYFPS